LPGWTHRHVDFSAVRHPREFATAVAAALPERAIVVGWSLGGQLALAAAREWPERVAAVVAIGTSLRFTHDDPALGWAPRILARMQRRLADAPRATLAAFAAACFTPAEQAAGRAASYVAAMCPGEALPAGWPLPALQAGLEHLAQTDLTALPEALAPPLLWLHGAADPICPPAAWDPLRRRLAHRRWLLVPEAGHALPWTHPAAIAAAMREFSA